MDTEGTFFMVKPDAIRHAGNILWRAEKADLRVTRLRLLSHMDLPRTEKLYEEHKGKPFYGDLLAHTISGPILIGVLEGEDAVKKWRALLGATDPLKAAPGTIRGDWGTGGPLNAAHGSASTDEYVREFSIFMDLL